MCRLCRHSAKEHEHYREGTDCVHFGCSCPLFIETRIGVLLYRAARKVIAA